MKVEKVDAGKKLDIGGTQLVDGKFYELVKEFIGDSWRGSVVTKRGRWSRVILPGPNVRTTDIGVDLDFDDRYRFIEVQPGTKFEVTF